MLSLERVNALLSYDQETGLLIWRVSPSNNIKIGQAAGTISDRGYLRVRINHKQYPAHRLAWMLSHGYYPEHEVDHINGNKLDNKLTNLRLASRAQNNANMLLRKDNTSGFKGVSWRPHNKKWVARMSVNGKRKTIGHFATKEEAAQAYINYSLIHQGEFSPFKNRNTPR